MFSNGTVATEYARRYLVAMATASAWLRQALSELDRRDPVESLVDARKLYQIQLQRCADMRTGQLLS
jgi:hypothetical protein